MRSRRVEAAFIVVIMLAVLVGGRALVVTAAQFGTLTISVLAAIALFVLYAFRRSYRAGGPLVRLQASRDAAFLAAIAGGISFVIGKARWSLGATIVAVELALVVELLSRMVPAAPTGHKDV